MQSQLQFKLKNGVNSRNGPFPEMTLERSNGGDGKTGRHIPVEGRTRLLGALPDHIRGQNWQMCFTIWSDYRQTSQVALIEAVNESLQTKCGPI